MLGMISRTPSYSLGFGNVLADIAWLEAVQVAGNMKMARTDYDRLYELLNVVANFDRRFETPYLLGGMVLGESKDHGREALRVLDRGKAQFPRDWRFPFYKGFTYYFSLGNPEAAGKEMAEASWLPASPAFLPGLASRMLSEARNPVAALAMLDQIVHQETDSARRSILERRIREVVVERDLQNLERAVEEYREKAGDNPRELSDLVRAGILPRIPAEPNGGKYILEAGGKVRSSRVMQRLLVFKQK